MTQYSAYTMPWTLAGGMHTTWLAVGVPTRGHGRPATVTAMEAAAFGPVGKAAPPRLSVRGRLPPNDPTLPLSEAMVGRDVKHPACSSGSSRGSSSRGSEGSGIRGIVQRQQGYYCAAAAKASEGAFEQLVHAIQHAMAKCIGIYLIYPCCGICPSPH